MYDRIVAAPGQAIYLGTEGGNLILQPPGQSPGEMTLTDLQNRTWHLLREDGPDTGFAAPTSGNFSITTVTRDLNIALGQFISETGIAPALTERMDTLPVYAVLDYPLPPALVSLLRVEYTPYGQQTYKLEGFSMEEFDSNVGTMLPNDSGQPRCYREPFAGYIRLNPQPSQGNTSDTITFYYSSLGNQLVNPGDTPGIPKQFHMAIVYRVLMDYWRRKQDLAQAKEYERMYEVNVSKAKAYVFDSRRSTQPTIAGDDIDEGWQGGYP